MLENLVKKNGIAKHLQLRNILLEQLCNEFSNGQRFYSERELMRLFSVSSLTVSRAMKSLAADGIVERRVGGGTFVMKSGEEVMLLTNNTAPFVLYVNILPRNNIAAMDPLNWFISNEIRRGIVNSFNGKIKMLSTAEISSEIKSSPSDGCILVGPTATELKELRKLTGKLVCIDVDSFLPPDDNCIKWECMSGVYDLIAYFVQNKHNKIALIAGEPECHKSRVAGFRTGCETFGMRCLPEYIKLVSPGSADAGARAMHELLELGAERPTAVFVDTDIKAEGAIQAVLEAGLRVPEDISIAGFDDIPDAKYMRPPLTTVKVPYYDMGVQAVRMLSKWATRPRECLTMKTELIVRESTGPKKN